MPAAAAIVLSENAKMNRRAMRPSPTTCRTDGSSSCGRANIPSLRAGIFVRERSQATCHHKTPNPGLPGLGSVARCFREKCESGFRLASVGSLHGGGRFLLALVGVADHGALVRCRLLADDGAFLAALEDEVFRRKCRRGNDQRQSRDSKFEFHQAVSFFA